MNQFGTFKINCIMPQQNNIESALVDALTIIVNIVLNSTFYMLQFIYYTNFSTLKVLP